MSDSNAITMPDARLKPLPGKALIVLEPYWNERSGLIHIPQTALTRRSTIGRLLRANPTTTQYIRLTRMGVQTSDGSKRFLFQSGDRMVIPAHIGVKTFEWRGRTLGLVDLDDIAAWIEGETDVKTSDGDIPRCKWCGPAKGSVSQNAMLMVSSAQGYYCPRCYKNVNGEMVNPDKVTVSDAEVEEATERLKYQRRG